MADFGTHVAGLRAWAEGDRINTASVELLITHEMWLHRRDFLAACTDSHEADEDGPAMTRIRWDDARSFADGNPRASTTELAVLRLAVAIGSDEYRLASMGRANAAAIMRALATALRAEGMIRG